MSDSSEVYYVVLRGAGRQPIFNDDDDRRHFTRVVAEAAAACGVTVHAYCWLPTEARLAAQVADVPIARFAQYIADKHTRRLKRRIALTGSLFEQQFRGVLVDGRTELPELVRHIHLAPLKAGLAEDPTAYRWSSHLVYMGLESAAWVTTEPTLRHFVASGPDPLRGYIEYMTDGAKELDTPPPATSGTPQDAAEADDGLHKK